jgi:hypothetical protein
MAIKPGSLYLINNHMLGAMGMVLKSSLKGDTQFFSLRGGDTPLTWEVETYSVVNYEFAGLLTVGKPYGVPSGRRFRKLAVEFDGQVCPFELMTRESDSAADITSVTDLKKLGVEYLEANLPPWVEEYFAEEGEGWFRRPIRHLRIKGNQERYADVLAEIERIKDMVHKGPYNQAFDKVAVGRKAKQIYSTDGYNAAIGYIDKMIKLSANNPNPGPTGRKAANDD